MVYLRNCFYYEFISQLYMYMNIFIEPLYILVKEIWDFRYSIKKPPHYDSYESGDKPWSRVEVTG
jgi:hypothetical protein